MLAEGKSIPERKGEREQREVSYTVDEPRGTITGLAVWGSTSIRELLIDRLQTRLIEFDGVDIYALSESALRKWSKFAGEVDALLREAQALLDAGRQFFTDANMKLFEHLRLPPLVFNPFRRQRWDNMTGRWRSPPK